MNNSTNSIVEKIYLKKSGYKLCYPPVEKINSIVIENFRNLGKLTSLRFIEWVQKNPGKVVSLPTGKTPEHFIKWTQYYLNTWNKKETQRDLEKNGINTKIKPDIRSLHFVQIDEFYPISPKQENSFFYYINKFYINDLGLNKNNALLIDTSKIGIPHNHNLSDILPDNKVNLNLRFQYPKTHSERMQKNIIYAVDQFCIEYEEKIREKGGIGFFLGGIGPDGHIGFNIKGSDFFSTTRLTPINYETAAAAATDLGGIEISRNRLVITIGLSTITYNKNVTAIIIAAGEAKADITAKSIQCEKDINYPASSLQNSPNARFYITQGAASNLIEKNYVNLKNKKKINTEDIKKYVINFASKNNISLDQINSNTFIKDRFNEQIIQKSKKKPQELINITKEEILRYINEGITKIKNSTILHTSPHHDDEMLGYLSHIIHLIREASNKNYFSYMTSGFTSVTNQYMLKLFENLKFYINTPFIIHLINDNYFEPSNNRAKNEDIYSFLDGLAANDTYLTNRALAKRLTRILVEVFREKTLDKLKNRIHKMIHYFNSQYPGKKDIKNVQTIKGMIREFEAELVWGYFGFESSSVIHARLGFYTGDIFTKQPEMSSDVMPTLKILQKTKPDIVTVALDPEGSGPDTHYKVLQTIAEALKIYEKKAKRSDIKIWGYRNVWYQFHPAEANLYIPTSLNSITVLNHSFLNCFGSQKDASFPSYMYDGPFSGLAQQIMVQQYETIKGCLGEKFFYNNPHPRIRATRGFVFMKELSLQEFYKHSQELKKLTEL